MSNADCILIQGSNVAEAHPVAFQWISEARQRGATVIHVDPRFSRTSANADKHVPIRAGSDIVFLGALIKHILDNELYFEEYVRHYTNASQIISEDYQDPEDLNGLFSGFNEETGTYDTSSWQYSVEGTDPTLQHPRCVFQILRRHYARYTPELVEQVCGISAKDFAYVAKALTKNSGRDRTSCFVYAVGWTQHTQGAQYIRTAAMLQLLLGNMGRPGGGVMALRGHATIQGSTDIPTLFHILPGYLPMPVAGKTDSFERWVEANFPKSQKGFWANGDVYLINLLKAWWGDAATAENNFAYDYLPRLTGAHGTYQTLKLMEEDGVDGYFVLGQNPAVGSANGRMQRKGMAHLKWMVVRDAQMIETANFWKESPEHDNGEVTAEDIETEVFFMPAALYTEKAGSFTQTQRMVQWREQAVLPPDDARSELEFFYDLGKRIKDRLADSTDPRDLPLQHLTWDYPVDEHGDPDAEAVLAEINGYQWTENGPGQPLDAFAQMKDDGSTAGGCWIYTGVYAGGQNMANRRKPRTEQDFTAREWGWAWPANRRILYNRASADPQGRPWSERKKYIWWDEESGKWTGHDVPDFPIDRAPSVTTPEGATGPAAIAGDDPFIMKADGKGWLFAPKGMVDGPLPTHFESPESTVRNLVYPQQNVPTRVVWPDEGNMHSDGAGTQSGLVYPHLVTTYRLTEHHTAGGMSRFLPYLSELQPEMFVEVDRELAQKEGLENGGWVTLISGRSAIEARVLVTDRFRPLTVGGRTLHQIGMPYHWANGSEAVVEGDSANDLLGIMLDPNTQIQESKSAAVAVRAGRRPRGQALLDLVREYQERAGLTPDTGGTRLGEAPNPDDVLKQVQAEAEGQAAHQTDSASAKTSAQRGEH